MTEQLRIQAVEKTPVHSKLEIASIAGEPVAKYLHNLSQDVAFSYTLGAVVIGIQESSWLYGIGLLATGGALTKIFDKFYDSYEGKPAEERSAILRKVTKLQKNLAKRPHISITWK